MAGWVLGDNSNQYLYYKDDFSIITRSIDSLERRIKLLLDESSFSSLSKRILGLFNEERSNIIHHSVLISLLHYCNDLTLKVKDGFQAILEQEHSSKKYIGYIQNDSGFYVTKIAVDFLNFIKTVPLPNGLLFDKLDFDRAGQIKLNIINGFNEWEQSFNEWSKNYDWSKIGKSYHAPSLYIEDSIHDYLFGDDEAPQ